MSVGSRIFTSLFGAGLSAEIITRAARFLGGELRGALDPTDQPVTRVRLRPGETYTVVARPRPTRRERRLSAKQASLVAAFEKQSRPSRSQLRAARRLARTQRRLDRTRPGTRRHARRSSLEERRGNRFDRMMRPTRRQIRSAEALDRVSGELAALRSERFEGARRSLRPARSVTVYE